MKLRAKPQALVIRDADHASEVLSQIAARKRRIEGAWASANIVIDEIKTNTTNSCARDVAELADLEAALTNWAEHNRASILPKGQKSLRLVHGIIGWRASSKLATLKGFTWPRVLGVLTTMRCREAVRVKEEVDKEVLATWPEERLATVGVYIKKEDTFFYELDQVEPGEKPQAEVA